MRPPSVLESAMKEIIWTHLPLRALLIGLAAIAPVAFPAAQAGYTPFTTWLTWRLFPQPYCSSLRGPSSENHPLRD